MADELLKTLEDFNLAVRCLLPLSSDQADDGIELV